MKAIQIYKHFLLSGVLGIAKRIKLFKKPNIRKDDRNFNNKKK